MFDALIDSVPLPVRVGVLLLLALLGALARSVFVRRRLARLTSRKPRKRKIKDTARPDDDAKRILLVDDSHEFAVAIARQLRHKLPGVAVDVSLSGEEGLVQLNVNRYAVALVDIGLRGIGGATFVMQARKAHPDLAAILMSGHAAEDIEPIAQSCGAVAWFAKPFDVAEVVNALGPFLSD